MTTTGRRFLRLVRGTHGTRRTGATTMTMKPSRLWRADRRTLWGTTHAVLVLAGLLVTTADSTATTPSTTASSAVGRYNLVSANSQCLSAIVSENPDTGFQQEVTGGHADLRADRTCSVSTEYRYTESGRTSTDTSVSEGTWVISGDTVTFTFRGDQLTGTLSGEVLTVRADVALVYQRQ